jgi:uncharacterized protein (DUF1330 family)
MYSAYRAAMRPILERYRGGFRYDFRVSQTLIGEANHEINRVFAIYFPNEASKNSFFSDPEYVTVKQEFFEKSVGGTTITSEYTR